MIHVTAGKGGDTLLSFRTFRHLFATLNLKLVIFLNRIASNYQTAAQLHKRCYFFIYANPFNFVSDIFVNFFA